MTASGAGSGVCELTNQSRQESLKETGAKTERQTEELKHVN